MADDPAPRARYGEAFRRAHHEAWKRSDLNQREYCEAQDMARQMDVDIVKSLDAWIFRPRAIKESIDRVSHALRDVFGVFPPRLFLGRDRHGRIRYDDQ